MRPLLIWIGVTYELNLKLRGRLNFQGKTLRFTLNWDYAKLKFPNSVIPFHCLKFGTTHNAKPYVCFIHKADIFFSLNKKSKTVVKKLSGKCFCFFSVEWLEGVDGYFLEPEFKFLQHSKLYHPLKSLWNLAHCCTAQTCAKTLFFNDLSEWGILNYRILQYETVSLTDYIVFL